MNRSEGIDNNKLQAAAIGGISAFICATILSIVGAILIMKGILAENTITLISTVIAGLSVFLITWSICKKRREKRLQTAIGIFVVYLAATLLTKLAFFPGELSLAPQVLLTAAGSSVIGCLAANSAKRRRRR